MKKYKKRIEQKRKKYEKIYELIMTRTQRTFLKYQPTTAHTNKNPIRYTYTGIVV